MPIVWQTASGRRALTALVGEACGTPICLQVANAHGQLLQMLAILMRIVEVTTSMGVQDKNKRIFPM